MKPGRDGGPLPPWAWVRARARVGARALGRVRARTARTPLMALGALTALTVAAAPLCGCAGPRAEGRTGGVAGAPPLFDIDPVPRDRVRTGGTLRWPLPELPAQWNLHQVDGGRGAVDRITRALLPYPMRSDQNGVPRPDENYVLDVGMSHRSGRQIVTYHLNPRARWSDGTPITYADYAAQATALSGRDRRYLVSSTTGYDQIASVRRGANPYEVVVTFTRPFAEWQGLFAPLYPARTGTDPAVFNTGWLNTIPVTAGPFRLETIDQTARTVSIVRDARWWGPPAKLDRIVYRAMDPRAMPGAFANGEVDAIDIGTDADAYRRALRVTGAVVRRANGSDWRHLTFNAAGRVLSDERVRQAVALGIDRAALARASLSGLDWPARTLDNHFFMNGQPGYRDNSGGLGDYDPVRAGRLLDEAGWVRWDGGVRVRDGRPLELRYVVPSGIPSARQEGELAQAMLKRIGVGVVLRSVPVSDLFDKYITPGDFDIVAFSWLGTPYPVSANRPVFAMPQGDRIEQNFSRIGSPEIDQALDQAAGELDPERARELINRADRLIWRQMTVLPLYQRPELVATRADLANFGASGFLDLSYEDIGYS